MTTIAIMRRDADPERRAYFTNFARFHHYRIGTGWYQGDEQWAHGQTVDELRVQLSTKAAHFTVGETVTVKIYGVEPVVRFTVRAIEMVDLERMTDAQWHDLGYANRQDWLTRQTLYNTVVRGWMLHAQDMEAIDAAQG